MRIIAHPTYVESISEVRRDAEEILSNIMGPKLGGWFAKKIAHAKSLQQVAPFPKMSPEASGAFLEALDMQGSPRPIIESLNRLANSQSNQFTLSPATQARFLRTINDSKIGSAVRRATAKFVMTNGGNSASPDTAQALKQFGVRPTSCLTLTGEGSLDSQFESFSRFCQKQIAKNKSGSKDHLLPLPANVKGEISTKLKGMHFLFSGSTGKKIQDLVPIGVMNFCDGAEECQTTCKIHLEVDGNELPPFALLTEEAPSRIIPKQTFTLTNLPKELPEKMKSSLHALLSRPENGGANLLSSPFDAWHTHSNQTAWIVSVFGSNDGRVLAYSSDGETVLSNRGEVQIMSVSELTSDGAVQVEFQWSGGEDAPDEHDLYTIASGGFFPRCSSKRFAPVWDSAQDLSAHPLSFEQHVTLRQCGNFPGNVSARVLDCEKKNGNTAKWDGTEDPEHNYGVWHLVARSETRQELWKDEKTGLLWSSRITPIGGGVSWQEAQRSCPSWQGNLAQGASKLDLRGLGVVWSLPNPNRLREANENGFLAVLPPLANAEFRIGYAEWVDSVQTAYGRALSGTTFCWPDGHFWNASLTVPLAFRCVGETIASQPR